MRNLGEIQVAELVKILSRSYCQVDVVDVMRKVVIIIFISSACGVCGGVQRHTCVSPPTGSHPSAQYSRRCSEWMLLV